MRIVQTRSADAHILAVNALGAGGHRYHFGRLHVQVVGHDDAGQHLAAAVVFDVYGNLGEFLQHQSKVE